MIAAVVQDHAAEGLALLFSFALLALVVGVLLGVWGERRREKSARGSGRVIVEVNGIKILDASPEMLRGLTMRAALAPSTVLPPIVTIRTEDPKETRP